MGKTGLGMLDNQEKHPSFGMLQFSRTSGGATNLFGSSIKHKDTIRMYLRRAKVGRDLNHDWYFGDEELAIAEMSYSQFAEAITSMNQGTGVPVTLKYLTGEGRIDDCPFVNKKEQFENEFSERLDKANEKMNALVAEVTALMSDKKNLGKGDMSELLQKLQKVQAEVSSNSKFTYQMFNEQMDKTTSEAKGEIEAFMQNKIHSIANMALIERRDEIMQLHNPVEFGVLEVEADEDEK